MKETFSFLLLLFASYCQTLEQESLSSNILENDKNKIDPLHLPQFSWIDPLSIQVLYPDYEEDVLHLRAADRVADIVVRCLFNGNFEKEISGSFMVSGCMNDSYVYLTVYSSHLPETTSFIWERTGVIEPVVDPYTILVNETASSESYHFEDDEGQKIDGKRMKRGTFSYSDPDDFSDYSDYSDYSYYAEDPEYSDNSNSSEYYDYNEDEEEYYDIAFDGADGPPPPIPPDLILPMNLAYDEKMLEQMKGNHSLAQQYVMNVASHGSLHMKHPSLGTRIHLQFMGPPQFLSGRRLKINRLSLAKVQEAKKNEAVPLIAFTKTDDSNQRMGVAFPGKNGGICHETKGTGVLKWRSNPLVAAISFSHENGHMTGLRHDFREDAKKNLGNKDNCEGTGIMSRGDANPNRPAEWSECSAIRIRMWYHNQGHCLIPAPICNGANSWSTPCTCGTGNNSVACLSSHTYCVENHFGETPNQCLSTDDLKALAMPQNGALDQDEESISSRLMLVVGILLKESQLLNDKQTSQINQQNQITKLETLMNNQEKLVENLINQLDMERNGTDVSSKKANFNLLSNKQPRQINQQDQITNQELRLANQEKLMRNQEKLITNLINQLDMERNGTDVSLNKTNLKDIENLQRQITNQETRLASLDKLIENQELRLTNQQQVITNLTKQLNLERNGTKRQITNQETRMANQDKLIANQELRLTNQQHLITNLTKNLNLERNGKKKILNKTILNGTEIPQLEERVIRLEKFNVLRILRTCNELEQSGVNISGYYDIDPDGDNLGHPPIKAYCNFEDHVTEILHDIDENMKIIPYCNSNLCYTQNYTYMAHMDQIASLMQLSTSCDQTIEFSCYGAPLARGNHQLGVWVDRQGRDQIYFHGSNSGRHTCSCDSANSCAANLNCNCDASLPAWKEDAGKLTDMNALPVKAFKYGPLIVETQQAKVRVGRLRCGGGKVVVGSVPRSCRDLKLLGETKPGIYHFLDSDHGNHPKMSYCQLDKPGYDGGMESNTHWLKLSSGPGQVFFSAQYNENHISKSHTTTITFDTIVVNQGSGMDGSTGIFTAPVAGVYEFKISGMAEASTGTCSVKVYLNGEEKVLTELDPGTADHSFSRAWVFSLKSGDKVSLIKTAGEIEGGHGGPPNFQFIGILL